jgi:hypothetical protein
VTGLQAALDAKVGLHAPHHTLSGVFRVAVVTSMPGSPASGVLYIVTGT